MRRLRTRARHAVDRRFRGVETRLETLIGLTADALARLAALEARVDGELSPALRAVVTEEAANRRRLHELRATPAYAAAFADPAPLVSITIPTRDRPDLVLERSLASALAQTHAEVEVVVVGDAAGPEVERAIRAAGDPRVRWADTTHRVEHPDPLQRWHVASTLPRNLAAALARGAWIVELDDDDALRPDAVERLLSHAREHRCEVAYGDWLTHEPDGPGRRSGAFPPGEGTFAWQGAIVHGGLRYFERELFATAYGMPGDRFRLERMLRAGVRFGHLPAVTWDYYPSLLWLAGHRGDHGADAVDVGDGEPGVQRQREQ